MSMTPPRPPCSASPHCFLILPASFGYLLIMLVREAALIVLVATAPISAAGLVNDATKSWFWKSLRWYFSSLLIAPFAALVLGIGVKITQGVISGASDQTIHSVGMAVVGAVLIAIGAVSPMILFRLLAFVEPGTASGAAMRQAWSDAGGLAGVAGNNAGNGTSAATTAAAAGGGQSQGESTSESKTQSRMSAALGGFGEAMQAGTRMASKAADIGADVLNAAGVGHPGYGMSYADEASNRGGRGGNNSGNASQDGAAGEPAGTSDQATPASPGNPSAPPTPAGTPGADGPDGDTGPDTGATGPTGPWRGSRSLRCRCGWCGRRSGDRGGVGCRGCRGGGAMSAIRYGTWAKDRQTWFLGMSGPGLIAVLAGGLPLLTAVTAKAWWFALAWLPAWVVLVVIIAVPVRGRPAARWLADLAIATTGGVMGWTRWQSKAAAGTATNFAEADLPGVLAGIRTHDGPPSGPHADPPGPDPGHGGPHLGCGRPDLPPRDRAGRNRSAGPDGRRSVRACSRSPRPPS